MNGILIKKELKLKKIIVIILNLQIISVYSRSHALSL